jgi:creatinine amidohydrolase/Fe(II)-dependent formamide hydrolase-like protein
MDKAIKHIANFPETDTPFFLFGGAMAAWLADDWGQEGVFGDATIATVEKGQSLIEAGAKQLAKIITIISTIQVGRELG